MEKFLPVSASDPKIRKETMSLCPFLVFTFISMIALSGCNGSGSYQLHLQFPDEESRQAISEVSIGALDPQGHTCEELVSGELPSASLTNYTDQVFSYPSSAPMYLPMVPARRLLFYAEGRKGKSLLLRGCSSAEVKASTSVEVTVPLVWVCHLNPDGELPGNGLDDDCDQQTDEAQICEPEELRSCTCGDESMGSKRCAEDGTHWLACKCQGDEEQGQDGGDEGEESAAEVISDGDGSQDGGELTEEEGQETVSSDDGGPNGPIIDVFGADPTIFIVGQPVLFSWSTRNTTSCTLDGVEVATNSAGYSIVRPCPREYVLRCSGEGGNVFDSVTLSYTCPNPILAVPGDDLVISSAAEMASFTPPSACFRVLGGLWVHFTEDVVDFSGLYGLVTVTEYMEIYGNNTLTNIDDLCLVTSVHGINLGNWYDPNYDAHPPNPPMPADEYGNPQLQNLRGLAGVTSLNGSLVILRDSSLVNLQGLENLTTIQGDLYLFKSPILADISALGQLRSVFDTVMLYDLPALYSLHGLENLTSVFGTLALGDTGLQDITALSGLHPSSLSILHIEYNQLLGSLNGLQGIQFLRNQNAEQCSAQDEARDDCPGTLIIRDNAALANLDGLALEGIDGNLVIQGNDLLQNINALVNLTSIAGDIEVTENPLLFSLDPLESLMSGGSGLQTIKGISIGNNNTLEYIMLVNPAATTTYDCVEVYNNPALLPADETAFTQSLQVSNGSYPISISSVDSPNCP